MSRAQPAFRQAEGADRRGTILAAVFAMTARGFEGEKSRTWMVMGANQDAAAAGRRHDRTRRRRNGGLAEWSEGRVRLRRHLCHPPEFERIGHGDTRGSGDWTGK